MRMYIVYYKFKPATEKKPGPVRQFRIYANSLSEVREIVTQHGSYKDIEVLRIAPV